MKLLLACALLWALILPSCAQSVLFQQNFDAGGAVSSYIDAANPGTTKFNYLGGASATIINNALQFDRSTGTATGGFARTTNWSPTPTSLYIQMDFEVVSATTTAGSTALVFYVGSGFTANQNAPAVANQYARFGIGFNGIGHAFTVRYIGPNGSGSFNSQAFVGRQTLTFVLNNTGYRVTYLQPGGGFQTLNDDMVDLWVGNTKVFNSLPALTPNLSMTEFKLRVDDDVYAAVFQFDNLLIRDISGALPISLTHFTGEAQGPYIRLNWQTAITHTSKLFAVERRTETGEFVELGTSLGTNSFTDEHPVSGLNVYRLRHTDRDGVTSWSKVVQVRYEPNQPALVVLENPTLANQIQVRTHALDQPMFQLTTLTGQPLPCLQRETPGGGATLLPQHPLPPGVYLLTATDGATRLTRRVLLH